jgi:hypothetical protein
LRALTALALVLGIALRLRQYVYGRSLWLDEGSITLDLLEQGWRGLLRPLDRLQGAPVGWLLLQRGLINVFGSHEQVLRLLPFVAGLALLGAVADLARRILPAPLVPLAVLFVAVAPGLIRYANEVKQYSSDAFAVVVLADLGVALVCAPPGRLRHRLVAVVAGAGLALTLLSHVAILAAVGVLAVALLTRLVRRDRAGAVSVLVAATGAAAGSIVQALTTIVHLRNNYILNVYWRDGYPPVGAHVVGRLSWLARAWSAIVADPLHLALAPLVLVLVVAGTVAVTRERGRAVALVLVGPIAVQVAAGMARKYPLAERLALDLVPLLLVLLAAAVGLPAALVGRLVRRLPDRFVGRLPAGRGAVSPAQAGAAAVALLVLGVSVPALVDSGRRVAHPTQITELRPVFAEVQRELRPGDLVWAYWGSSVVVEYYSARSGLPVTKLIGGFDQPSCDDGRIVADLPAGASIWLIAGTLDPKEVYAPPGPGTTGDLDAMERRLGRYAVAGPRITHHHAGAIRYTLRPSATTGTAPRDPGEVCVKDVTHLS